MTKARDLANIISTGVPNSLITLDAAEIPNISTDKLTSGTLANARVADFPASKTTSGTFIDARLPSTALNSNVDLTTLSASNLTSGTVATARLGTGTADGTTFLRGDQTFAVASSSDYVKIATVNGTGSSGTINVDECFSSTYRKYIVLATLYVDTVAQCYFRFRTGGASGADVTTQYYRNGNTTYRTSSVSGTAVIGAWNSATFGIDENANNDVTMPMAWSMAIFEPFDSARDTNAQATISLVESTTYRYWNGHIYNATAQSVTGFTFYMGSGNFRATSEVTVYGLKS